jgi:hypothetical protein
MGQLIHRHMPTATSQKLAALFALTAQKVLELFVWQC